MQVGDFLNSVLPTVGHRFVTFVTDEGKPVQRAFDTTDTRGLVGFANWGVRKGWNTYFAVGGFGDEIRQTPAGEWVITREASNAIAHRCLRMDIDCGEGKPYPDQPSAIHALAAFCKATGLPTPTVVNSGYGIHVYWPFDTDLPTAYWREISGYLHAACVASQFHTDSTATRDAARVLRLPGTWNVKNGGQVAVQILCAGAPTSPLKLLQCVIRFKPTSTPVTPVLNKAVPDALRGLQSPSLAEPRPPYKLRGVLAQCPGFRAMMADRGACCNEPRWKATLDVCHQSAETPEVKERVARHLSSGHPGFTEEGFTQKWAQTQRQNYEPSTCERFATLGMPECATCPLRAQVKSPVVLGREQVQVVAPSAPVLAVTPASQSTFTISDGQISERVSIAGGIPHLIIKTATVAIGHYRLLEAEVLKDDHAGQNVVRLKFDRAADGHVWVDLSHTDRVDSKAFNNKLTGASLYYRPEHVDLLRTIFLVDFLSQLQQLQRANRLAGRCGWSDNQQEFSLGTHVYTKAGVEHGRAAGGHADLVEAFHQAGDEHAWREAFSIAMQAGPDRAAVLALAIASPLMVFSGISGLMVNAYSPESGVGKSTLCDAALSIWGSPKVLMRGKDDTLNARFKVAGAFNNLPYVIDECTNMDGKQLSDFVYSLTQGKERGRLTSNASLNKDVSTWCLPVIATANNSVHAKLQSHRNNSEAEAARVFEIKMRPLGVAASDITGFRAKLAKLRFNYGFLGPKLAALYTQHAPSVWTAALLNVIDEWDRRVQTTTKDRFYSTFCALCEIGAKIGNSFGLNFDIPAMKDELLRQWTYQTSEYNAEHEEAIDVVTEYYRQKSGEFLTRGTSTNNMEQLFTPQVSGGRAHAGEQVGTGFGTKFRVDALVIPLKALLEFADTRHFDRRQMKQWLDSEWQKNNPGGCVIARTKLDMFAGTLSAIKVDAVKIDPKKLGIAAESHLSLVVGGVDTQAATP